HGVGVIWLRQATSGHISVADGFDLLQAMAGGDLIKLAEALIEFADQLLGRHLLRDLGEADKVGKQYRRAGVAQWLDTVVALQLFGHTIRENIKQQAVGLPPLLVEIPREDQHQRAN